VTTKMEKDTGEEISRGKKEALTINLAQWPNHKRGELSYKKKGVRKKVTNAIKKKGPILHILRKSNCS